jgi:hypothetical protein
MGRNDYTKPLKSFLNSKTTPSSRLPRPEAMMVLLLLRNSKHFHLDRPFLELFPRFFD